MALASRFSAEMAIAIWNPRAPDGDHLKTIPNDLSGLNVFADPRLQVLSKVGCSRYTRCSTGLQGEVKGPTGAGHVGGQNRRAETGVLQGDSFSGTTHNWWLL